ncbi:MAG: hypothetical protein RIT45_4224 [Pseudomonadota bacterium]
MHLPLCLPRPSARGSLVLLAAVALLLLPGCGKKDAAEGVAKPSAEAAAPAKAAAEPAKAAEPPPPPVEKQTVLLWHAYRDAERGALDALVAAWNKKHPEIELKALAVPYDALIDKTQVAIPRGNGPDLIIIAHDKIGTWARDGLIAPLGAFATPARLHRFLPVTVKPLVFERAVYGLPMAFKSLALFYNKALVAKPPATIDELVEAGKKHTDAEEGKFGLAYDASDLYQHAAWLHAYGGLVFDEESRELKIDTPEAAAAIEAVRKLHKDDGVLGKGMTGFIITAMFNDGKVPFVFNGPWFISEIDEKLKWGVATLPTAPNGSPLRPYLGSEAVLLSAHSKAKDAALTIMDYLTSDEAALTRITEGKQMVANVKIYEDPRFSADPVFKVFRAQADQAMPMSNSIEAGVAWTPYSGALRKAIFGDAKPAEALSEAQKQAAGALEKLRK